MGSNDFEVVRTDTGRSTAEVIELGIVRDWPYASLISKAMCADELSMTEGEAAVSKARLGASPNPQPASLSLIDLRPKASTDGRSLGPSSPEHILKVMWH